MPILQCPDHCLAEVVSASKLGEEEGLARADVLLAEYEQDARLYFLRGSLLAGLQRYEEAHSAMAIAVRLAPTDSLARFQLGFLELTCGDGASAVATLHPLLSLPKTNYLRVFAEGLIDLIRDEFIRAATTLEQGVKLNANNLPLNKNMQILIDEIHRKLSGSSDDGPQSTTQTFLQQFTHKGTKH